MKYNPPKEDKKPCSNPSCNMMFTGRKDKKYCSIKCKNSINNASRIGDEIQPNEIRWDVPINYFIGDWADEELSITDPINPDHYKGDVECIDAIKASMSPEAFKGYLKGNIMKYTWRDKENKKEDLDKAKWYINKLKEQL